jgi:hypothetical protein
MDSLIPKPVLLNCWKHHLGYIIDQIRSYSNDGVPEKLKTDLLNIGNSTTDLYTGKISPDEAGYSAIRFLKKSGKYEMVKYKKWIRESEKEYRCEKFPDNSVWIFKLGNDRERYIHIHPGRYVPETLRVKASVLKISIASMIEARIHHFNPMSLECINHVRKTYLDLSPVKNIRKDSELYKILTLILSGIKN